MSSQTTKYKTAPMKLWNEVKNFKQKHFEEYRDIKKKGGTRILSSTSLSLSLHAGFDNTVIMGSEPFAANIAYHEDFGTKCLEECERHGLGREVCGYSKCVWGAQYLNQNRMPDGSATDEWFQPDMATSFSLAPCHNKWFQLLGENAGTNFYLFDLPMAYPYNKENVIKYLTGQVLDYIEFAEKKLNKKFDDEKFIQAVKNECQSFKYWAEALLLNTAKPAPLDEKTLFSFIGPNLLAPYKKETVDFYRRFKEEVGERVEQGIAAVGNEQFRVITDAIPPWTALQLYRYCEKEFGVVVVGSPYVICLAGTWMFDDNGLLKPTPTPEEAGMPLNTREDAARAICWYKSHFATETPYNMACGEVLHELTLAVAKQWKADGGMLHQNQGCTMQALGSMESRNSLAEHGIPCINYEGNDADSRDIDMSNMTRKFDTFFEACGVKRLTK